MSSTKGEEKKKGAPKGPSNNNLKQTPGKALLSVRYPVNSTWEFTLPNDGIAAGTVYCTDETSQIVVLQKSLVHTTLAFEVRMVQVSSITKEKLISSSAENSNNTDATLSKPLPVVQKKALEEREKRAVRMAEESFRHINQNVSLCLFAIVNHGLGRCYLPSKLIDADAIYFYFFFFPAFAGNARGTSNL